MIRQAFTRRWTVNTELLFHPDTEMLEFVCNENEKDRQHFVQPSSTSSAITVDPAVLARYAGCLRRSHAARAHQSDRARSRGSADDRRSGRGRGSGVMVPLSQTTFRFRGAAIEFVSNENGEVTHLSRTWSKATSRGGGSNRAQGSALGP